MPIFPIIQKRQWNTGDLFLKGAYEEILAPLRGALNKDLVRQLLAGDEAEVKKAMNIISTFKCKDFMKELGRLIFTSFEASLVLVKCHGKEALPIFKEALKNDPESPDSGYIRRLIKELESSRD
jgi:hypothetical protein